MIHWRSTLLRHLLIYLLFWLSTFVSFVTHAFQSDSTSIINCDREDKIEINQNIDCISESASTNVATMFDQPDDTTTMWCETHLLNVQNHMNCGITPMKEGVRIITEASVFTLSGGGLELSQLTPTGSSKLFNFTAYAQTKSLVTEIANGIGKNWEVTVTDNPDSTSTLTCQGITLQISATSGCKVMARSKGIVIHTDSSHFTLSGGNKGTIFGALTPQGMGYEFNFVFTPGPETGYYSISDGISDPLDIALFDIPDQTSLLNCSDTTVGTNGSIECISNPRKNYASIFSNDDVWFPTAIRSGRSVGSFSQIGPARISTEFHFTYTAPESTGPVIISDGIAGTSETVVVEQPRDPDGTSSFSCLNHSLLTKATTICIINSYYHDNPVWSDSHSFKLSDGLELKGSVKGVFSSISPYVSKQFKFSYTAGPQATDAWIDIGVGSELFHISIKSENSNTDHYYTILGLIIIYILFAILIVWGILLLCQSYCDHHKKITRNGDDTTYADSKLLSSSPRGINN